MKTYEIVDTKTGKTQKISEKLEFDTYFNELINDHVYNTTLDPDNVDQEIDELYKDCKQELVAFGTTKVGTVRISVVE